MFKFYFQVEVSVTTTLDLFDELLLTLDTLFGAGSGQVATDIIFRYNIAVQSQAEWIRMVYTQSTQ